MRKVTILLAVLAMVAPAYGANVFSYWENNNGDNDFHSATNWDIGLAPPAAAVADNWYLYVKLAGTDYSKITGDSYSYRITAGYWTDSKIVMDTGTYTVQTGEVRIGTCSHTQLCEVIQNGGTLNSTYGLDIGADNGNSPFYNGYGEYTITGGTLSGGPVDVAMGNRAYYGLFKVVGTDPVINVSAYNQAPIGISKTSQGSALSEGGVLEVVLVGGGNGVSVISAGDATLSGTLHVDVTGYTGTQTVIDILTAGTLTYKNHTNMYDPYGDSGVNPGDDDLVAWTDLVLSADNIAAGYILGDNGSGTLQVTIPEPAMMVLLGIGGTGMLIRRKRR